MVYCSNPECIALPEDLPGLEGQHCFPESGCLAFFFLLHSFAVQLKSKTHALEKNVEVHKIYRCISCDINHYFEIQLSKYKKFALEMTFVMYLNSKNLVMSIVTTVALK